MSKKNRKSLLKKTELHAVNALVDIVIPVYGRFDLLEECLTAIPAAAGDIPYNVVVVDNASPKDEADLFYPRHPEIILLRNKENLGFPKACNQAARRKQSPLIFFLNSDAIMRPDSIKQMVMRLDDPKVGVVGAKLLYPEDSSDKNRPAGKVQHVGIFANIHGQFNHIFMGWSPDHPKVLAVNEVTAVTGAALMVRRSIWNKVGGFDESYGLGTWEDADLCMSVAGLGYKIVVEQKAVGIHYTSATATKYGIRYPLTMNQTIFMSKWTPKLVWSDWLYW